MIVESESWSNENPSGSKATEEDRELEAHGKKEEELSKQVSMLVFASGVNATPNATAFRSTFDLNSPKFTDDAAGSIRSMITIALALYFSDVSHVGAWRPLEKRLWG